MILFTTSMHTGITGQARDNEQRVPRPCQERKECEERGWTSCGFRTKSFSVESLTTTSAMGSIASHVPHKVTELQLSRRRQKERNPLYTGCSYQSPHESRSQSPRKITWNHPPQGWSPQSVNTVRAAESRVIPRSAAEGHGAPAVWKPRWFSKGWLHGFGPHKSA